MRKGLEAGKVGNLDTCIKEGPGLGSRRLRRQEDGYYRGFRKPCGFLKRR